MKKSVLLIVTICFLVIFHAEAQLLEALKKTEILSSDFDLNNPAYKDFESIRDGKLSGSYFLNFSNAVPKGKAFLFRSISKQGNYVRFASGYTKYDSVMSYNFSCRIQAFRAIEGTDTAHFDIGSKEKTLFTVKSASPPIVRIEDLKAISFTEGLLIMAYSARFHFKNVTWENKGVMPENWMTQNEAGVLISGKDFIFNNGQFTQYIDEEQKSKDKAIKMAKDYAVKIETALAGLPVTTEGCGNGNFEKCDEDGDFVYQKIFKVQAPLKTVFFDDGNSSGDYADKYLFTIRVQVSIDGGFRPEIEIDCK